MTPFLHLYSWHGVCMNLTSLQSKAETRKERFCVLFVNLCTYASVHAPWIWACVQGCVCKRACTFQLHACVFGFEVAACCQPVSSTLCASYSRASVPRGEAGKTCGGEPGGAGGRPNLPAACSRAEPVGAGQTPKIRYLKYLLWLHLCVLLRMCCWHGL